MGAPLHAVLFDLDGTLLDTAPDFHRVINRLLEEQQRPTVSYDFLRAHVSNGARAMVSAAFGLDPEHPDFGALHQRMLELYLSHLDVDTTPFEGIDTLLDWLEQQQIPWGVVTNKPELYTLPVMSGLNLTQRAACIICPDHVSERKPHPEALLLACTQIGCDSQHCVYIGDHQRDIECGRRAGMLTIGALYGYLDEYADADNWQADHYVNRADALKPLLQSIYALK